MRKNKWIFLLLTLFAVLVGCESQESINVGILVPLTGDAAIYGEETQKGITLALQDLQSTNKEINVYYEDACLAGDAVKGARTLINLRNVDMINGLFCIIAVQPIVGLTESNNISIMMTAAVPDPIIDLNANVFSSNSAIKDEAYAQAEFLYNELEVRNISIVWMNTDFGKSYNTHITKRFEELGGRVLTESALEVFGTDYRTELTLAKNANPDALVSIHFGNQMALVLRQAHELGLEVPVIGTYESEDEKILDVAGKGAEQLIFSTPIENFSPAFHSNFRQAHGEEPSVLAAMAYDAFMIQVQAHLVCDGNRTCMNQELSTTEFDGAAGTFTIGKTGTAQRNYVFKTVENGAYVLY